MKLSFRNFLHFSYFLFLFTVTYPALFAGTDASEVQIENVVGKAPELDAWQNLKLGGVPVLTSRISHDTFITLLNTGQVAMGVENGHYFAGCCADTIRIFDRDGSRQDIDINALIKPIFVDVAEIDTNLGTPYAYANHVRDLNICLKFIFHSYLTFSSMHENADVRYDDDR